MATYTLAKPLEGGGYLEEVRIEPCGVLQAIGWGQFPTTALAERMFLRIDGEIHKPDHTFRLLRTDVATRYGPETLWSGFCNDFIFRDAGTYKIELLWEHFGGKKTILARDLPLIVTISPDYENFFTEPNVVGRERIYGSGPPAASICAEIVTISEFVSGRVLDYGCGAGLLVKKLRERGIDAYGLELDRLEIHSVVTKDLHPYVRLSDGSFPSPWPDRWFDTVFSVEVIEHIGDYANGLADMARLTRDSLILTTPDISAIPMLHRHQVVPWHLLEASHVSFFTQDSLYLSLTPFFKSIDIYRIGPNLVNGTSYYTSLLALCSRPCG